MSTTVVSFVDRILSNHDLVAAISVVTLITRIFLDGFRNDIYEPITDYIFPDLFKDIKIENPGKRPIRVGSFFRKVVIWLMSISLLTFLF